MSIKNLAPKGSSFRARLVNGHEVEIHLRPFTLSDVARNESRFEDKEDLLAFGQALSEMKVDPVCQVLWEQMTPESKNLFADIKFTDFCEEKGEQIEVSPVGWEKLKHSFADYSGLIDGLVAYYDVLEKNGFVVAPGEKKKKKAVKA